MVYRTLYLTMLLYAQSTLSYFEVPQIKTLYRYFEEIGPINSSSRLSVIIYYHSKDCSHCELYDRKIADLVEYYKEYVNFYKYDCKRAGQYKSSQELYGLLRVCHEDKVLNLPTVTLHRMNSQYYRPYTEDYEPTGEAGEPISFTEIEAVYTYIDMNLPSLRFVVKTLPELFKLVENDSGLAKIIYFSDYAKTTRTLKFLSIRFKDQLEVA